MLAVAFSPIRCAMSAHVLSWMYEIGTCIRVVRRTFIVFPTDTNCQYLEHLPSRQHLFLFILDMPDDVLHNALNISRSLTTASMGGVVSTRRSGR